MNYSTFASSYVGTKEGSDRHHYIVDYYNTIKPLPNGYKAHYNDPWCAIFVSFVLKKCRAIHAPYTASANDMRKKAIMHGQYRRVSPKVNDIVFYDWNGNGNIDHVGIVKEVLSNSIIVIEGNKSDMVGVRTISKNSKSIAGYATVPHETTKEKNDTKNKSLETVAKEVIKGKWGNGKTRFSLLKKYGYNPTEVQQIVNKMLKK